MTERHSESGRRTIDTVLGPIKVIPECKAQAVCVNGLKCWEAGRCLKAADEGRRLHDLEAEVERLRQALIPFAFIGRASMKFLGLAEEYDEARKVLDLPPARLAPDEERP